MEKSQGYYSMVLEKKKAEAANFINCNVHNVLKIEVKKGIWKQERLKFYLQSQYSCSYFTPLHPFVICAQELDQWKPLQGDLDGYEWHRRKHPV